MHVCMHACMYVCICVGIHLICIHLLFVFCLFLGVFGGLGGVVFLILILIKTKIVMGCFFLFGGFCN